MLRNILFAWLCLYVLRRVIYSFAWGKKWSDYFARRGLTMSLMHIVFETNYFNTLLFEWFNEPNRKRRELMGYWFDCGIFVMAFGQVVSVAVLSVAFLMSLLHMFPDPYTSVSYTRSEQEVVSHDPIITPIIPGVNFPSRFLLDFWVCTFVVIVVHEFGHAAAASMERLQIQGCGFFFLFMFPGAYVRIEESIQYIPTMPQLRVYCAGVWHNVLMAGLCMLGLWALPTLLSGAYTTSTAAHLLKGGVVVTHIAASSPLFGSLAVGDVILALGDKQVCTPVEFGQAATSLHASVQSSLLDDATAAAIESRYMSYWSSGSSSNLLQEHVLRDVVHATDGVCVSSIDLERLMVPELQCCRDVLLNPMAHGGGAETPLYERDAINSCFMHTSNKDRGRRKSLGSADLTTRSTVESTAEHSAPAATAGQLPLAAALYCLPAKGVLGSRSSDTANPSLVDTVTSVRSCAADMDCQEGYPRADGRVTKSDYVSARDRCLRPLTPYPSSILSLTVLQRHHTVTASSAVHLHGAQSANSKAGVGHQSSSPANTRIGRGDPQIVLFEGTADELVSSVSVGEYMLKPWLVRAVGGVTSWLFEWLMAVPETCALYLWLCVQLNLSVAFVNMLPVYTLDGGLACPQFCRMIFSRWDWEHISTMLLYYGTFLLLMNLVIGVLPFVFDTYYSSVQLHPLRV